MRFDVEYLFIYLFMFTAIKPYSRVWVLDRRAFQQIMMRTGLQRIEENVNFLKSVPLLKNLSEDVLCKIADVLELVKYNEKPHICTFLHTSAYFSYFLSNVLLRLSPHLEVIYFSYLFIFISSLPYVKTYLCWLSWIVALEALFERLVRGSIHK